MTCQIRHSVIIIAMTVIIAGAYRNNRDVVSFNPGVISHHKTGPRSFFYDQSFIDKIIGQQILPDVPVRDQSISQQALHEAPLKERSAYPSSYPIFRQQPSKQNLFHMITAFKDEPLFRDALLKDHELRGERAIFRNSPFEGQSASLASEIFEEQASTYRSQAPFKKQLLTPETPFKNLFHGQSPLSEQAPFQKQTTYVDFPPISKPIKFYRDDSYGKPIDSYGGQKNAQAMSYGEHTMYIEYDNHPHKLSSMPMVSPSQHLAALNAEMPAMPLPTPVTNHGSASPTSSVSSGISEVNSSDAFKMKLGSASTLESAISTLNGKCNTLVDSSSTMPNNAVTTVPSISFSTNQSSIVDNILTSLTTKPNSPVMATMTPIMPSMENTLKPIHFQTTKYGAVVASPFISQNQLKSKIHTYPHSETPKSSSKIDEHNLKYLMAEVPKNNMKTDNQSPMLNYILSEEQKGMLKSGIQNSFTNNALPEVLEHGWSLQQFSHPETLISYAPLSPSGKMKLILPSTPVASASAISWPLLTKHDVPEILPAKSAIASDWSTNNNVPLEMNLPVDFMASMPNSLTASIGDSISGSITGNILGGMTTDMPASIPTLNLGQSLHRVEQLRQTQEARNPWYPTGLQLQLGGFGGINYTLHTSNPRGR